MAKGNIVKISQGKFTETSKGDYVARAKNINTNAAQKISEKGKEGIKYGEPEKRNGAKDDAVNVIVGMFFDGTNNNAANNTFRATEKWGNITDLKNWEKRKINFNDQSSYQNDPSNVQLLQKYYPRVADKYFSVYIEGVATTNAKKDKKPDAGLGYFGTGIIEKVRKGCQQLANRLSEIAAANGGVIDELTLDVFGFSRGSTCARNFVYEITKNAKDVGVFYDKGTMRKFYYAADESIKYDAPIAAWKITQPKRGALGQYLLEKGIKVKDVKLRFAGLFDSVSAYGIAHFNDVWELDLNDINKMTYIVHLTAADEHRDNFELTAVTKGITKTLPGVHSDVGGGYRDQMHDESVLKDQKNEKVLLERNFRMSYVAKRLVEQGWYKDRQLKVEWNMKELSFNLNGTRKLSNKYSFIPLHIMAEFCKKYKVNVDTASLDKDYKIPQGDPALNLREVYERLYAYAFQNAPPMTFYTATELQSFKERVSKGKMSVATYKLVARDHALLMELRNRYLHYSADYGEFGMHPTQSGQRKIFNKPK